MVGIPERQVLNQGEQKVFGPENVLTSGTTKELKFDVSKGQAWRVQEIDIEAPPLATVTLKYGEELSGDDVTLGTFYAYEFPLAFKPTATDNHMVIMEDRTLSFQVYNTYANQITVRARTKIIKTYLQPKGD